MAIEFIVEDGNGLPNANSYSSVAQADQYHENVGNAAWADAGVTEDAKQIALIRATQYIEVMYNARDYRKDNDQALQFPTVRQDWPSTNLVAATCELALRALTTNLLNDTDTRVQESVKVGPIAIRYKGGVPSTRYTIVDALISDLIGGGVNSVRVFRA